MVKGLLLGPLGKGGRTVMVARGFFLAPGIFGPRGLTGLAQLGGVGLVARKDPSGLVVGGPERPRWVIGRVPWPRWFAGVARAARSFAQVLGPSISVPPSCLPPGLARESLLWARPKSWEFPPQAGHSAIAWGAPNRGAAGGGFPGGPWGAGGF